jgi:hypothetical protein
VPTRVAVIADTHLTPSSSRDLPVQVWAEIERADLALHAGDVTTPELLDRIGDIAPVVAVLGNNDVGLDDLPARWEDEIDGVRVAMVHDSGTTKGRANRMRRWFPEADLVVFGHSHAPVDEAGADGQRLLNPGSPTQRRRQPVHTMAVVTLDAGTITTQLVELSPT